MALKLSLESTGPGRGLLRIGGTPTADVAESVNLAIQRNDGRYLGLHGQWQPTPHWHPQFSAEPDPAANGFNISLGAALLDGIIAMQGAPLRVTARLDDQEDSGVLRIRGALVGSDAACEPTVLIKRGDSPPAEAPDARRTATDDAVWTEQDMDALSLDDLPADRTSKTSSAHGRRIWPWVLAGGLLLLLGAGIAAWSLGWLDDWLGDWFSDGSGQAQTEEAPIGGIATSPHSKLTGVAFASEFLAADPTADAILAQARTSEQAGDCDAALLLYNQASERDAALGIQVARLYDPTSFAEGGCIDAASEDTALEYYLNAADAGVPEAMQRAGEILTGRADSGPLHEQGIELLRRARQR